MTTQTAKGKNNTTYSQALNTFKPYAVLYRTGGQVEKFHFLNGWGASVASHDGSYGLSLIHI